jgi:hypothetical protein
LFFRCTGLWLECIFFENLEFFLGQLNKKLIKNRSLYELNILLNQEESVKMLRFPFMSIDSIVPFEYEELIILIFSFELFKPHNPILFTLDGKSTGIHFKDSLLSFINSNVKKEEFDEFLIDKKQKFTKLNSKFTIFIEKEKKLRNDEIKKTKFLPLNKTSVQWRESRNEGEYWVFFDGKWIKDDPSNVWNFDFYSQK